MSLGHKICFPDGRASFGVKLMPYDPALTMLELRATLGRSPWMVFPLVGENGMFKGRFSVAPFCLDIGQPWEWSVRPVGGAILLDSTLRSIARFRMIH
jgi:hypothetical protein